MIDLQNSKQKSKVCNKNTIDGVNSGAPEGHNSCPSISGTKAGDTALMRNRSDCDYDKRNIFKYIP